MSVREIILFAELEKISKSMVLMQKYLCFDFSVAKP
ncbi:hypothetical protein BH160DRAFT_2987 [Burkholderia sp. H160]|nr:hypothetical protein BH160DRAFT_2987 [Burkholderia sp. H160]